MNQNLHDLTGFGTLASKSNCFSNRNNYDVLDETNNIMNTGCNIVLSVDEEMVQQSQRQ